MSGPKVLNGDNAPEARSCGLRVAKTVYLIKYDLTLKVTNIRDESYKNEFTLYQIFSQKNY